MESDQLAAIVLAVINCANVIVSALNRCKLQKLERTIQSEAVKDDRHRKNDV